MEREREEDQDKYGWTHSRSIDSSGATISNMRRDARARAGSVLRRVTFVGT